MTSGHWLLLLTHACASVFMTGLIWVIQLVHYPLMARVGADAFVAYEQAHMNRITLIVGPMMLVELVAAVAILFVPMPGLPKWMAIAGVILLAVLWLSTMLVQGPAHVRLARGYDAALIGHLVLTNWVRTLAWSLRGVLSLAMIFTVVKG